MRLYCFIECFRPLTGALAHQIMSTESPAETAGGQLINPLSGYTGFQRDLFVMISRQDGEPSGQELLDEIQPHYESEITHGRMYPNLDVLVEKGLVEKGSIDRRTNSYVISERGEMALETYQEWVARSL